MREIKFRAWVPKMKQMFHNVGFCSRGVEVYWYDPKLEEETVLGDRQENSLLQHVILMQYTGLKDKNGKEIYEGDVIDEINIYGNSTELLWLVYFYRGEYRMKNNGKRKDGRKTSIQKSKKLTYKNMAFKVSKEIIGNIYENPELVETKNDKESS